MTGNQRSSLKLSRARRDNMAEYDALPKALREWLAEARLPWSPASARRAWRKAMLKSFGRPSKAVAYMNALEDTRLAQDSLVREREAALRKAEAGRRGAGSKAR